jgi:tetratricopeptide (TPR) repeat protein
VVNLSLAINYALGGTGVWGYHAFNLVVHILAALTLFGVVRRTLARPVLLRQFGAAGVWVALAVAVIWTVHPLQTEAVTYISQRCESLMGLFYLLTLYCFIRGVETRQRVGWLTLSVAACFLGMASKEVMVTAPVMVLLYDRIFVSGSFREAWARHKYVHAGLATSWILLGCLMPGVPDRGAGYGLGVAWFDYAQVECRAVVQYLRLALWPHPLVFDYGSYVPTRPAAVAPYALLFMALAITALLALGRRPALGFVGAWFFLILAPTSSVVPVVGSPMAEHRMYLPLAAAITMVVVGAFEIGKQLFHGLMANVLGYMASGLVVLLFTFLTIQRNQVYHSALRLSRETVRRAPGNPRAHCLLGTALLQAGKVQDAIEQYERAVSLQRDYADAHNDLGVALVQQGRLQEAIGHYQQALRVKPDAEAHNNMGVALMRLGRLQEAISHYQQALQLWPDYAEAHNNLANALFRVGEVQEALVHWQRAVEIRPDYAEAYNGLAGGLAQAGKGPEAIRCYEQVLRLDPGDADAHYNLGLALEKLGRTTEAITHLERALQLNPDLTSAHSHLGDDLARLGKLPEAVQHLQLALQSDPDSIDARYNLGLALAQLGRLPEAIEQWKQTLRLDPGFSNAHYNLGLALEKLGRKPEATAEYQAALKLQPDLTRARDALARLAATP